MEERSVIREKSFEFALETIDLYKKMLAEKEYVISKQLLRSATSVGANVEEAANLNKADELVRILTAIVKTSQSTN